MRVKLVVPALVKADLDRVTYRCESCEIEIERLQQRAEPSRGTGTPER